MEENTFLQTDRKHEIPERFKKLAEIGKISQLTHLADSETLEKIKSLYFPLLNDRVKQLLIIMLPDSHRHKKGYCLVLGSKQIEYRKKTTRHYETVILDVETGTIKCDHLQHINSVKEFVKIIRNSFNDLKYRKAMVYFS